jgi:VanZ family protein
MPAEAGTQNSRRHVWLTAYVPLIIWTCVVLGLGSGTGSMNETSRIIRPLLEFIFPSAPPETLAIFHGYIRKLAHFVEYAVLAFFAFRVFAPYKHRYGLALVLAASVAAVDEFNQSLNPARTSSPWDVALDITGAASTIAIFALIAIRRRSIERRVDQ